MRQLILYTATALVVVAGTWLDPASVACAETLFAGREAKVAAATGSSASSSACLRLGACANKSIHTATPAKSENFSDGLLWNHNWVSFKVSGNGVKFGLHF